MRFLKSSVCACVFSAPTFLHDKVIDTAALTQGKLSGNASNPCLVFIAKTPSLLLLLQCLLMPLLLPTCCYLRIRKKSGKAHYCVSFFSTGLGDANIMHPRSEGNSGSLPRIFSKTSHLSHKTEFGYSYSLG